MLTILSNRSHIMSERPNPTDEKLFNEGERVSTDMEVNMLFRRKAISREAGS